MDIFDFNILFGEKSFPWTVVEIFVAKYFPYFNFGQIYDFLFKIVNSENRKTFPLQFFISEMAFSFNQFK